ncbi:MAG: hypothetical protein ACRDTS_11140 [Mycobacterium sp.]
MVSPDSGGAPGGEFDAMLEEHSASLARLSASNKAAHEEARATAEAATARFAKLAERVARRTAESSSPQQTESQDYLQIGMVAVERSPEEEELDREAAEIADSMTSTPAPDTLQIGALAEDTEVRVEPQAPVRTPPRVGRVPRRHTRPVEDDDEDLSNRSWLE